MPTIDAQVHAYERNHPGRPWAGFLQGPPEVTGASWTKPSTGPLLVIITGTSLRSFGGHAKTSRCPGVTSIRRHLRRWSSGVPCCVSCSTASA